jgi:hypothetical protein
MKIGVVSEGATEEGRITFQNELRPIQESLTGALHVLVRRILKEKGSADPEFIAPIRTRRHGKGGLMKDLVRILTAFEEQGIPTVAVVLDRAGDNKTIPDIVEAARTAGVSLRVIPGQAVEMFEAWLIADESAVGVVLKRSVPTGPDPESRPGEDSDPASAKRWLDQVIGESARGNVYDVKKTIAETTDMKILEKRCKKGFARFRKDLIRAFS